MEEEKYYLYISFYAVDLDDRPEPRTNKMIQFNNYWRGPFVHPVLYVVNINKPPLKNVTYLIELTNTKRFLTVKPVSTMLRDRKGLSYWRISAPSNKVKNLFNIASGISRYGEFSYWSTYRPACCQPRPTRTTTKWFCSQIICFLLQEAEIISDIHNPNEYSVTGLYLLLATEYPMLVHSISISNKKIAIVSPSEIYAKYLKGELIPIPIDYTKQKKVNSAAILPLINS